MQVGDTVAIISGQYNGCSGEIRAINSDHSRARVRIHYTTTVAILDIHSIRVVSSTSQQQQVFIAPGQNITIRNGMVFSDPGIDSHQAIKPPAKCTCGSAAFNNPGHWGDCALKTA